MTTKTIFAVTFVVIFVGIAVFVFYRKGVSVNDNLTVSLSPSPSVSSSPVATQENNVIKMDNGLEIQDLKIGSGPEAKMGDTISVNYSGSLDNGTVFDASSNHGGPATFQIGVGQLIKGWDIGIPGMKIGGKRKLIVPPSLGYGSQDIGNGLIPPNSTLVFEVELLAVQASPAK